MRALALLLVACSSPAPSPAKPDAHEDEKGHALAQLVHISAQVRKGAGIETAVAGKAKIAATLTLPGEVTADPNKIARVASPAAGRVEHVALNEGSVVHKGELIMTLKVPELGKVRSAYAASAAKAKAARSNASRLGELADKQVGSKQAAMDAEAEASALESEAHAAAEQIAGMGLGEGDGYSLVLRAPIDGVLTQRNAVVGQPVTANEVLATVAQLDEVWFLGRIFEKDLGEVRQDARAEVQLNAYPKQRFPGKVDYVGKQVDPVARTLTARIRLYNKDGLLRLGLFGSAHVELSEGTDVLAVPSSALTEIAGKPVVFVEQSDGDFVRHEVVVGREGIGQVEILAGLNEGERVASEGVFSLKSILMKVEE